MHLTASEQLQAGPLIVRCPLIEYPAMFNHFCTVDTVVWLSKQRLWMSQGTAAARLTSSAPRCPLAPAALACASPSRRGSLETPNVLMTQCQQ